MTTIKCKNCGHKIYENGRDYPDSEESGIAIFYIHDERHDKYYNCDCTNPEPEKSIDVHSKVFCQKCGAELSKYFYNCPKGCEDPLEPEQKTE